MSTIVTRAGKGTALTWTEMDDNFTNLNNDKYEAGDDPTFGTVTAVTYNQLPVFNGLQDGVVNAGANGTTKYLREDGSWEVPPGSGAVADGDKGDITVSGSGATWTIDNGVVTLAKQADVATASIMGRVTAGTGVQEALTGTQATTLLDTFTSALKGLAPASGGGTTNYLRADGTWAAPPGTAGTVAGSDTQIQYNAAGSFGAEAAFTYNYTSNTLTVPNLSMSGDALITGFVSAGGLIGDYLSLNQPGSAPVRGWYTPSTTEMRGNIATTNILNLAYTASYSFTAGLGVVPTAWSNTILPTYAFEFGDRGAVAQFSGSAYLYWNTKIDSAYAEVARTASGTPAGLIVGGGAITLKAAASNPGAGSAITFTNLLTARGNSDMDVSLDCGRLKFPATANPSSNVNTLDDYEEGTWTPTDASGAGLSFSSASGTYVKIGQLVYVFFRAVYPATASGADATIGGLPFTTNASANTGGGGPAYTNATSLDTLMSGSGTTTISLYAITGTTTKNSNMSSAEVRAGFCYLV